MKLKMLLGLFLSLLTLAMFGCGDDGGGESTTTVKGIAAAGPIVGGTVTLSRINSDGTTTPLTTTPTTVTTKAPFGNFSAAVSYSGPLLVQVAGGTYTDEASGVVGVPNGVMQAAVANASGTIANLSVTPITSMAVIKASQATGVTPAAAITAANAGVAKALGLPTGFDIINTPVADPSYTFALQAISKGAQTASGNSTDPAVLATAAANAVTGVAAAIDTTTGAITDPAVSQQVAQAKQDAFAQFNPPNIDGTTVAGITLSPSQGVINIPLTVTANVSKLSGGAVADGTTVTFTSSAGSITATATTTGGVATAILSGISTPQQVANVTATAGTVTASLAVTFISDPNAPASVAVVASKALAIANGTDTVTFTATVTPADPVNGTIAPTAVTFTTTDGTLVGAAATTTNGVASCTLTNAAFAAAPFSRNVTVTATVAGGVTGNTTSRFINQPATAEVSVSTNKAFASVININFDIQNVNGQVTYPFDPANNPNGSFAGNGFPNFIPTAGVVPGTTDTVRVAMIAVALQNITANSTLATPQYAVTPGIIPTSFTIVGATASGNNANTPTPITIAPADFNAPVIVLKDAAGNVVTP